MDNNYVLTLQQEIEQKNKDLEAMRSELNGTDEVPASVIKTTLLPHVPNYIRNIDALAQASDSESVKLQANKLLIEWAVTDKLVNGGDTTDDEFKQLLKSLKLKANTTKEQ